MDQNILYQDNMAIMQLEVNGYFSISKRTKHIYDKFLFIKDRVEYEDIEVQYWSTYKMWPDVINKPKQGISFWLDCSHLQNVPVEWDNEVEHKRNHPLLLHKYEQASLDKSNTA